MSFLKNLLLLVCLLFPLVTSAAEPEFDYTYFSLIPVLHEGRIKPLDSVARTILKHVHSNTSLPDMSATGWLASAMFTPSAVMEQKIFVVRSQEVIATLGLPTQKEGYSFKQLAAAFGDHDALMVMLGAKEKKLLTPAEKDLVELYNTVNDFADVIGTFSLLLPLDDIDASIRARLHMPDGTPVSYLDALKIRDDITNIATRAMQKNGEQIEQYTSEEVTAARLTAHMHLIEGMDRNNRLLRIIPPSWGDEEWLSPWAVVEKSAGSPVTAELFHEWQMLAISYQQHDAAQWQKISQELYEQGTSVRGVRPTALRAEVTYNTLNLLNVSFVLYVLCVATLCAEYMRGKALHFKPYTILLAGACVHAVAIGARMFILMRPPVGTLYESMIFVSLICAIMGILLERKRQGRDGIFISAVISGFLMVTANLFNVKGDTLEVLVAVLNTNFWLATHVVCITTGYGCSLVAGMLAHIYLFRRGMQKFSEQDLTPLYNRIHMAAIIALFFTAVGTMLGGIWADQSWGRFWGWDPKENGALLIVLWLIWLLHARVSGQLRTLGFAAFMALITIVVGVAWVGVNLLSVGLHSYGFTDVAAYGLLGFCAAELAVVMGLFQLSRMKLTH